MLNAAGAVNATGRLYLLLDANVVADFFLGTHAGNQKAAGRIQAIVEAVRTQAVTSIVLYVPNICIPEVMSAFDKQAIRDLEQAGQEQARRAAPPETATPVL